MIIATLAVILGIALFFASLLLVLIAIDMGPPPDGRGFELWFPAFGALMGIAIAASPFL